MSVWGLHVHVGVGFEGVGWVPAGELEGLGYTGFWGM